MSQYGHLHQLNKHVQTFSHLNMYTDIHTQTHRETYTSVFTNILSLNNWKMKQHFLISISRFNTHTHPWVADLPHTSINKKSCRYALTYTSNRPYDY